MLMTINRRTFLATTAAVSGLSFVEDSHSYPYPIACNAYNWTTFYKRQNKNWLQDPDASFADLAKTGILAYEPGLNGVDDVKMLAPLLKKYNIAMPSVYVNSVLHKASEAQKSIEAILLMADEVKKLGTKIIVTNPSPIQWGSDLLKSDEELIEQAQNMEKLGQALTKRGLTLAYHTHDVELKGGAREFHHVMLNTSPQYVSFCFDLHWVYRGSGNSQVAVFDVLKLYGKRIVELHIRQSVGGVWAEVFGSGDIDYQRVVRELKALKIRPHLVIEQCVEAKTPHTMDAVEAHIKDLAAVKAVFLSGTKP
jgi:inosose dehydratase